MRSARCLRGDPRFAHAGRREHAHGPPALAGAGRCGDPRQAGVVQPRRKRQGPRRAAHGRGTGRALGWEDAARFDHRHHGHRLGLIGAALHIPVALVMPGNVSEARRRIARHFGARIIFSDALEQSDGAIRLARKLVEDEPEKWFYIDQYSNEANPRAHELGTAREIWDQTEGRVTHAVIGIGTGGTIMGTGRGLKARNRAVKMIAVEPAEALHGLEGLKHMPSSIMPGIYKESEIDRKLSIATDLGWDMAERLISDEGLLAGHSAGAAAAGALQVAQELAGRGERGVVVTLVPDRADRYISPP